MTVSHARVYAVAATRDGKTIAAGGGDGELRLYDATPRAKARRDLPDRRRHGVVALIQPGRLAAGGIGRRRAAVVYRVEDGSARGLDAGQNQRFARGDLEAIVVSVAATPLFATREKLLIAKSTRELKPR